jgi:uncharacterized protein (DUF2236 family)
MASILRALPRREPRGRPGDVGLFGPDSLAWRVNGEVVLLLGAGRALLMQLAHPAVAAAVSEHSGFPDDALGRLMRTMDTTFAITFGDSEQSRLAAARVNAVHERVRGDVYDALDPQLLLWVHVTLVDSALLVHDRFVGSLSPVDRAGYYREMKRQATVLRVPPSILPRTLGAFDRYVLAEIAGLEVTDEARRLAKNILSPPVPLPLRPAAMTFGLITTSLLPDSLREGYRLPRRPLVDTGLTVVAAVSRAVLPFVPSVLRTWPGATAARRRARSDPGVPEPG